MNMTSDKHILSPETQAILLLCGVWGHARPGDPKPLSLGEYNDLAQWLHVSDMHPSDLLLEEGIKRLQDAETVPVEADRMLALLRRGASMALAVESWTNQGMWVLSRVDARYPQRLKDRLKRLAPPILYGSGRTELLSKAGLAIIGSRDIDHNASRYTRMLAELCAAQGIAVISGGARGVDGEAMAAALSKGGTVVGILAKGLAQEASSRKFRNAIMEGSMVLVSPYYPNAAFTVGNAMGRNKYIYSLSDWALVVSSGLREGGTWSGANENLKHKWVPLFVRSGRQVPKGNLQLIQKGGIPFPEDLLHDSEDLGSSLQQLSAGVSDSQLHGTDPPAVTARTQGQEAFPEATAHQPLQTAISQTEIELEPRDLFEVVWPYLERELKSPRTSKELAERFAVSLNQMTSWLNHAVELNMVTKLKRPTKYIASDQDAKCRRRQLSLPFSKK